MPISEQTINDWYDRIDDEDFDGVLAETLQVLAQGMDYDAAIVRAAAFTELGAYEHALQQLDAVDAEFPEDLLVQEQRAELNFLLCHFDEAAANARRSLDVDDASAAAHFWLALLAERNGDQATARTHFARANVLDSDSFPMPLKLSDESFATIVQHSIDELPAMFKDAIDEVTFIEEPVPSDSLLTTMGDEASPLMLGLYVGTPKGDESVFDGASLPPVIYLFRKNIERAGATTAEIEAELKITIFHEIAHHLGFDEEGVDDLGLA